jgi:type III secretion protein R
MALAAILFITPFDALFSQTGPLPQKPAPTTPAPANPPAGNAPAKPKTDVDLSVINYDQPNMLTTATVLAMLALLPFAVMILTSFMKIVIVLSLLRSALGVQQAPPNQVINGVAFMLSLFVMYPTGLQMYDAAQASIGKLKAPDSLVSAASAEYILTIANDTKEPLREFLKRNSSPAHQQLFYRMAYRVLPQQNKPSLKIDDFIIIVPSFITSQLKDAFEIGVLIYIPFFVIDLVTSNILLAMGMMMLSPVTISMPLKLFLLVMLDGWTMLIEGLVSTYR